MGNTTIGVRDYGAAGDGVADDTAAIAAAIAAAYASGGGRVYLPRGTYKLIPTWDADGLHYGMGAIWLRDGVSLVGDGNDTVLKQYGPGNMIIVDRADPGNHDGIVIADLQLDGNRSAYAESAGSTDANDNLILMENCNQFNLRNVHGHHSYGYGVFMRNGCHDYVIDSCLFEYCGGGGRAADGIYITNRNSRFHVTNCRVRYSGRTGIMLNNEGPTSLGNLERGTIIGNICEYNGVFGISVQDNVNYCVSDDGCTRNIIIMGNVVTDNGTIGTGFRGGIQVANVMDYVAGHYRTHLQDIEIIGNACVCDSTASGVRGILLRAQASGAVHRVNVQANRCTGAEMGIQLVTNGDPNCALDYNIINGNVFSGNATDVSDGGTATRIGVNYHADGLSSSEQM